MKLIEKLKQESLSLRKAKIKSNPYIMLLSRIDAERTKLNVPTVNDISDEDILVLISREIKMLEQEAPTSKNKAEIEAHIAELSKYLPTYLTKDEIRSKVESNILSLSESGLKMGAIMGSLSKELSNETYKKGDLAEVVRETLG